jgi:3-isopropylmalate/(R)-2-methylmalate dehydratase small subunit
MQAFTSHTGRVVPLRRSSVDTDQIIPAEYLKRVTRTGFADGLFAAWRKDPDFVLNRPIHAGATILVAGEDFGVGSSREHAVWALQDFGFRVVISARFADIFRTNAAKCGLVTVDMDPGAIAQIWQSCEDDPTTTTTVDLVERVVTVPAAGLQVPITMDEYLRWRLIEGLDDIGLTLRHEDAIVGYESRRPAFLPATTGTRAASRSK